MTAQYTQGPWAVNYGQKFYDYDGTPDGGSHYKGIDEPDADIMHIEAIRPNGGRPILFEVNEDRRGYVDPKMAEKQWAEAVANAKLAASAPELLEALRECLTSKGAMAYRSHKYAIQRIEYMDQLARAAIAKATGGDDVTDT